MIIWSPECSISVFSCQYIHHKFRSIAPYSIFQSRPITEHIFSICWYELQWSLYWLWLVPRWDLSFASFFQQQCLFTLCQCQILVGNQQLRYCLVYLVLFFYPRLTKWGGGIGVASDVCPSLRQSVRPSCPDVRISFPGQNSVARALISFLTHTSLRRCRCAFWGFWNFTCLIGRPSAITNFNMPDVWQTVPYS